MKIEGTAGSMEIMAPAGSPESLSAALQAGAGSVYFGIGHLNMRSRAAGNFTIEDLPRISRRCKSAGVKSYLALNTVMFDNEMSEMRDIIDASKKAGIDAIIGSDIAVLEYARSMDMGVHLSTQCNVTNIESLRFYSRWADVIVLARELNLDQVRIISEAIQEQQIKGPSGELVRIEMFVHGALCMAVSGKCYLSLDNMNYSANRGACLQVCRKPYKVTDMDGDIELQVDNEYIMSPKDLCTIHILDKMKEAGVSVLKIEGRGRSADYVSVTTACYSEAVRALDAGLYSPEAIEDWQQRLNSVYNRGFWEGYYLGRKLGEWSPGHGSQASMQKIYVGKVINYYRKSGIAEVQVEARGISTGDQFMFIGPTTGTYEDRVESLHNNEGPAESVAKGQVCAFPVGKVVRRQDKVYILVDREKG